MIKRVLVDLSDTRRTDGIIRQATDLALAHQAELTIVVDPAEVHATTPQRTGVIAAAGWARELHRSQMADAREKVGAALEELCATCDGKEITYRVLERSRDPFQSTIDQFRFHDLFVCGSDASFNPASLEPGSEELIRLVEAGVRPLIAVADDYRPIRKTLIALSGAIDSSRTLKHYVHLNVWPAAETKIVTFEGEPDPEGLLNEAVAYVRMHGIEAEWEILSGPMSQELLPHAVETEADVVVLGNTDHSRLARWFFGGAVTEIIRESDRLLFLCR